MAVTIEDRQHVVFESQHEEVVVSPFDRRLDRLVEDERGTDGGSVAGTDQCQRQRGLQHAFDQRLDLSATGLAPQQPRLDHAGVVEHEQIVRAEQLLDVGEVQVAQRGWRDVQQATCAAIGQRVLRNQLRRQLEVKIGERQLTFGDGLTGHACPLARNARGSLGAGKGNRTLTVLLPEPANAPASPSQFCFRPLAPQA